MVAVATAQPAAPLVTSIVAPHAVAIGLLLADAKERAARPTLGEEQKAKAVTKEVWATEAHRRRSLAAAWYFSPTLEGGWEAWEAAARP